MNIVYNGEKDKAFKEVLGATIPRLCEEDDRVIYLDADLMNCIGTQKWANAHPERGIDVGIAEANMIGIAAGLSAVGFKPIVHTFGPFASRRVYDQVFLSGAYAKNSITIIGSDPGVCAAYNGGTHMPFEDMALYRAIPDVYVFDITDAAMLEDLLKQCVNIHGIKYIRVGRKNNAKMYEAGSTFEIGKSIVTKDNGNDCAIIACGIMVDKAMQAADILAKEGINVKVVDMFTVKPLDAEAVIACAKDCGCIVTAENHNKIGGLFSAVADCLASNCPTPVEYVAVEDVFGEVGAQPYLEKQFGLTTDHVVEQVRKAIARK
ncbi:MAG: transketolase C-terminal domain-containing protein [Lachnospiraceae bacterium]|nr:transketolase C-terminal domain-containing protein [Lachnospiraceae bacterium]